MEHLFEKYKPLIDQYLTTFLNKKEINLGSINEWGSDVPNRYKKFITRGKSVRGVLFLASCEILETDPHPFVSIAAAIEMIHAVMLIHDDIIDRDSLRRGIPTLSAQYSTEGKKRIISASNIFGENMSIVAGDIGIFWSLELLMTYRGNAELINHIASSIATEFVYVGLGEMADIATSADPKNPSLEEILSLYRYKTARYTFALPFLCAALVTKQQKNILEKLILIGESIGMLYQLQDDQFSLFGEEQKTGKAVGNDIRENKKTPYLLSLLAKATTKEKKKIHSIMANPSSSAEQIQFVIMLMKQYNIDTTIHRLMETYEETAKTCIAQLPLSQKQKDFFYSLEAYISTRDH